MTRKHKNKEKEITINSVMQKQEKLEIIKLINCFVFCVLTACGFFSPAK